MHLKHTFGTFTAGVSLVLLSGCYAPNGGYPPGAYSPYPNVPQQTFIMEGDALGSPSSDGASTFAPDGTLRAPDPAATRGTNGGSDSLVPLPRDPSATRTDSGEPLVSLGQPIELDFQSPIVFNGTSDRHAGQIITASGEALSKTPASHDAGYTWFKGRLEYVAIENAWHLTYDDAPLTSDQLGGDITLGNTFDLEQIHNGKIVKVSGQFEDSLLDRLQKPIFRVSQIDPL